MGWEKSCLNPVVESIFTANNCKETSQFNKNFFLILIASYLHKSFIPSFSFLGHIWVEHEPDEGFCDPVLII